jgi:hypothetical protein
MFRTENSMIGIAKKLGGNDCELWVVIFERANKWQIHAGGGGSRNEE